MSWRKDNFELSRSPKKWDYFLPLECFQLNIEMEKLIVLGKYLGLSGKELLEFAREMGEKAEKKEREDCNPRA